MSLTIEDRIARLEAIVSELESQQGDLAGALALFEEGVQCLREAAGTLTEAEARVQRLVELADGAFMIEELDDE